VRGAISDDRPYRDHWQPQSGDNVRDAEYQLAHLEREKLKT
jgi:hypothetical protein